MHMGCWTIHNERIESNKNNYFQHSDNNETPSFAFDLPYFNGIWKFRLASTEGAKKANLLQQGSSLREPLADKT